MNKNMIKRIFASVMSALIVVSGTAAANTYYAPAVRAEAGTRAETEYTLVANESEIDRQTILKGESVTVYCGASGGTGEYQYSVYYKRVSQTSWTCAQKFSDNAVVSIKPTGVEFYDVKITAKDSEGITDTKCLYFSVLAPLKNTSSISSTTITKGDDVLLRGSASGGGEGYNYAYYYKQASKSSWTCAKGYSEDESIAIYPAAAVDYDVRIKVKDSYGNVANKDFKVKVNAPIVNKSTADKTVVIKGGSVTLTGAASGGSGTYTYAYYYKRETQTSWTAAKRYSTDTTAVITPTAAVVYDLRVSVKDSFGNVSEKEFKLNVVTALKNKSYADSASIEKGQTLTVIGNASGGSGDYTYAYYYKQNKQTKWTCAKGFSNTTYVSIKPAAAVDYTIRVKVKDSLGIVAVKDIALKVTAPLKNKSKIEKTSITKGQSVTLTGAASGGSGEYKYGYYYKRHTNTSWTVAKDYSTDTTALITPTAAVDYDLCVRVKDSSGTLVEKIFELKVTTPLKNTSSIDKTGIIKGETITAKGSASGGSGTYIYAYYYKQKKQTKWTCAKSYSEDTSAVIKPAAAVDYDVRINVKDSDGNVEEKYFTFSVTTPLKNNSTAEKSFIYKGESVTLTGAASGGSGDYTYAYFYKQSSQNSWTRVKDYSTDTTAAVTPLSAVDYDMSVRVKDSNGNIVEKTFTLEVLPVLKNTSKISKTAIFKGEAVSVSASASGGTGEYTYAYYYKRTTQNSWTLAKDYSADTTADIKPAAAVDYDVRVNIKDSYGNIVTKEFVINVTTELKNNSSADKTIITKGESVILTGAASGGSGDYTYAYFYKQSSQNSWTRVKDYSTDTTAEITPLSAVDYDLSVRVKDSVGNVKEKTMTLTVLPTLFNNSQIDTNEILPGKSVTLTASASGGSGIYTYAYYYMKAEATDWTLAKDYSTKDTAVIVLDSSGSYNIRVSVKDSNGSVVSKDFFVQVLPELENTSEIDKADLSSEDTVTVTASASGGRGTYTYAYYYKRNSDNNWTLIKDYSNTNRLVLNLTAFEDISILVSVKDSDGNVAEKQFSLSVTQALVNNSYVSSDNIDLGDSVKVYTIASGGSGSVTFSVAYRMLGSVMWTGLDYTTTSQYMIFTPSSAGTYEIVAAAEDSNGNKAEKSFTVTVNENALDSKIEKILPDIVTSSMDDFDKIKAIHDWMIRYAEYDIDNYNSGSVPDSSYTAEGFLDTKLAVCDGYAKAFEAIASKAGLNATRVTGYAIGVSGELERHAWNQVQIDGVWYNIDVTWDDPVAGAGYSGDNLSYKYFLIPDSQFYTDHQASSTKYTCTASQPVSRLVPIVLREELSNNSDYAYGETDDDLKQAMQGFNDSGITKFTLIYKTDEKDNSAMLQRIFNNGPSGHGMKFSYRKWKFDGYWQITVTLT